jgi:UDP-2,3-diacylglucosamine pyrophosphatase LpxH
MKRSVKKVLIPILIFILILIIWMTILSSITLGNKSSEIIYPKISQPAIVTNEQNLEVKLNSKNCNEISFKIENEESGNINLVINNSEERGKFCFFNLTIPEETEEGLYDLIVNFNKRKFIEYNSVSIKEKILSNFTFISLTDLHIGDPRGFFKNPKEFLFNSGLNKIIDEINYQNPDFTVITGDLTFGQLYPFEYYFEYQKLNKYLKKFEVPVYLIPGNHDLYNQFGQDGLKFWEKYFGNTYYSLNYNGTTLLFLNSYDWSKRDRTAFSLLAYNWGGSLGNTQLEWIGEKLNNSGKNSKIIFLHHNPLLETNKESLFRKEYQNREDLIELIEKYDVEFVFAGHIHRNDFQIVNGTKYLTTTSALSSTGKNEVWSYRLIEVKNNQIENENHFSLYPIISN